jgi:molybdopterin synthase sulfur carrier subunit
VIPVTLLYFAAVRDAAGTGEEAALLPDDIVTVGQLSTWLDATRPGLSGRLGVVRFAVNEAFAEATTPIHEGDVIALIPPVSGG